MTINYLGTSFEFCALRFLYQWASNERELHKKLSDPNADIAAVRAGLAFFKVSRNFRGISPSKETRAEKKKSPSARKKVRAAKKKRAQARAQVVVDALVGISRPKKDQVTASVRILTQKLHRTFKKSNVSAASKLLWLRFRHPVVIYDKRAARGLAKLGTNFNGIGGRSTVAKQYDAYYQQWDLAFKHNRDDIDRALKWLTNEAPRRIRPAGVSDAEFRKIVKAAWFRSRVFDIYLWEIGGD
jgi:hypothetical protein